MTSSPSSSSRSVSGCGSGSRRRRPPRPRRSSAPTTAARRRPICAGASRSTSTAPRWRTGRFGRGRAPGEVRVRVVQPDVRAARLAVAAHRDRHRLRRHAVPRGLGEHGAQPARDSASTCSCTRSIGDESYMHIEVDRQARRASTSSRTRSQGVLAQVRAAVEDWQPMRERMEALVAEPIAAGRRRRRGRGGAGAAGVAVRPPLHVPRLPRVRVRRRARCAASRAPGSGCCAASSRRTSRRAFAKLPPAVRALAREPRRRWC